MLHAVPFVKGVSTGRRSGYKDAVVTGLSRIISGSGNLFKCRKGIELSALFKRNVLFGTRAITDPWAAKFLATFCLFYLQEMDRCTAQSPQKRPENIKSCLIIDDAAKYIGIREGTGPTTGLSSLAAILLTIRQSGRGFVAVSQIPSLVDPSVLALLQTVVQCGPLVHEGDTRIVAKMMGLDERQRLALTRLRPREAVAVSAGAAWPYPVRGYVPEVV